MKVKEMVLKLYKNRGETPLGCIQRFKKENPEYKDEKMTYAGRLDPLAEGLLLILVGEECKNKEKYLGLDKEYEVDVLFGFSTDTYDVLGLVTNDCHSRADGNPVLIQQTLDPRLRGDDTKKILKSFVDKFLQKYPPYSSKYFNKARSGELNDDEIETKEVEIKSIEFLGERTISKNDLEKYIIESINSVKGDFRQKEILKSWNRVFARSVATKQSSYDGLIRANVRMSNCVIPAQAGIQCSSEFKIISIRVNCTSGTYMRSLANSIGEKVGIPALALNIKRTKVMI